MKEWFDFIWDTKSERELKELYVNVHNMGNDTIGWEILFALEMKSFWFSRHLTNLQKMRERKRMPIEMLAKQAGTTAKRISKFESRETDINSAEFIVLERIANVLGCKIADIIEPMQTQIAV